jgi:hypothetical protein
VVDHPCPFQCYNAAVVSFLDSLPSRRVSSKLIDHLSRVLASHGGFLQRGGMRTVLADGGLSNRLEVHEDDRAYPSIRRSV